MRLDEFENLFELKMSPGNLKKEVQGILKKAEPIVGIEAEVCIPASYQESAVIEIPDINDTDTLEDFIKFFSYNSSEDWSEIVQYYEEWITDQGNDWAEAERVQSLGAPVQDKELKVEIMQDLYVPSSNAEDMFHEIVGNETIDFDIDNDLAKAILEHADEEYKKRGPVSDWLPAGADPYNNNAGIDAYAMLYYEMFYLDSNEADDLLTERFSEKFYDEEFNWDENNYTFGAYMQSLGHGDYRDVFHDNHDTLSWPGRGYTEEAFDIEVAESVAGELARVILEPEVHEVYGMGDLDDTWIIEPDTSIRLNDDGDSGFELKSPPTPYVEAMQEINDVFDVLNSIGAYTNKSTGLHINISIDGVEHSDVDYVKLIVMLGDDHILKEFGREINDFAASTVEKLTDVFDQRTGFSRDKQTPLTLTKFMDRLKSDVSNSIQYTLKGEPLLWGRNSIAMRDGYVEFRSMGGEDYLDDFGAIANNINRFIAAYAVAADPTSYRKQYAKKLYRIAESGMSRGSADPYMYVTKNYTGEEIRSHESVGDATLIFAAYSAGLLDKNELMLKMKQLKKSKRNDVYHDDIQTQARKMTEYSSISIEDAVKAITTGVKQEIDERSPGPMNIQPGDLVKLVYDNMKFDFYYYRRPKATRITPEEYELIYDKVLEGLLVQHRDVLSFRDIQMTLRRAIKIETARAGNDLSKLKTDHLTTAYENLLADMEYYD